MIVEEKYNNVRLDVFLVEEKCYASRSIAAKFCEAGKVTVNDNAAQKNLKLKSGDIVDFVPADDNVDIKAQNIPLDIKYEDDHIIVISKQPGLVCHPAHGHKDGTLVNALVYHCGRENLSNIQEDENRLGIIHRLDADTSGLMVCAKSNEAAMVLSAAMKAHSTDKHYKALVFGNVKQETGKIDVPLLRVLNKRPKMIASSDPKSKDAVTTFRTIERIDCQFGKFSLLDCKLHTGRTHQIRSHMEFINHPIVGDSVYNSGAPKDFDAREELGLNRQFLHSYKLGFNHPITGEYMEFEDALPKDLQNILNKLS